VAAGASDVHAGSGEWRSDGAARRAPDDHAVHRPPRGVPQPRQSAAGPGAGAPAGTGDQVVTRWRPMAPDPATAHRRTASRARWRRGRAVAFDVGDRRAAGVATPRNPGRPDPPRI